MDPTKPAELCHYGREASGLHLTGGWFHFVGSMLAGGDSLRWENNVGIFEFVELVPGFKYGLTKHLALVPEVFAGFPLVQLEFETHVPWVLAEADPEI